MQSIFPQKISQKKTTQSLPGSSMKTQTKIDYYIKSKNVGVCSVTRNFYKLFVKAENDQNKTKEENMLQPDLDTHITE